MVAGHPDWRAPRAVDLSFATATSANPGAGFQWFVTVPAGEVWRIYHARARLVTGAAVADRLVGLEVSRGGVAVSRAFASFAQVAGESVTYEWARLLGSAYRVGTSDHAMVGLPDVVAVGGDLIGSVVDFFQGADNWGAGTVVYALLNP